MADKVREAKSRESVVGAEERARFGHIMMAANQQSDGKVSTL
jgi:hypothetical protein